MPTTTGISPAITQTKSEPDAVLAAKTTMPTPKAINPIEIKYATRVSMFGAFTIGSRALHVIRRR